MHGNRRVTPAGSSHRASPGAFASGLVHMVHPTQLRGYSAGKPVYGNLFPELQWFSTDSKRKRALSTALRAVWSSPAVYVLLVTIAVFFILTKLTLHEIGLCFEPLEGVLYGALLGCVVGAGPILVFRSKVRCSLRKQLYQNGVPICLVCGHYVAGFSVCQECGSHFEPPAPNKQSRVG